MAARLVVLGLLVAGCQCWDLPVVNQGRRAQYYTQQSDGSYQYGFDTAEGLYQSQKGDDANEVRGQFGADGGKVEYTAGVDGFVVTSLKKPNAPATRTYVSKTPVRYATLEELATHPEQVDDTAEVKAAKASFQAAYDAAAAAADAAPDVNIITGAVPVVAVNTATYSAPAPQNAYLAPAPVQVKYDAAPAPVDASGRVVDTAEVKAAKASFQAAFDAAAAAADAAPDTNIITGAVPVVAVNTATYSVPAPHNTYLVPAPVQIKYTGPSAPVDASGRVIDTAEVKAAKASFQAVYDAAAAAAAAAPDVNIITASKQQSVSVPLISTTYGQEPSAINVASNDGSYQFSYTTHDSSRHESADAANNVQGNFEFVADDAQRRRVDYRAGAETGFVATGAHLPESVQDTAAVASAKASFKSAYDAAAAAAASAPDTDIINGAVPVVQTHSVVSPQTAYLAPAPVQVQYDAAPAPVDASGRVVDTAEVKAAKASFQAAYDAAAAAADAAPDTNIITGAVPVVAVNTATYSVPAPHNTYLAPAPVQIKYTGPSAPVDASGRVVDTAEVKAAKASFQAVYDAAAAAAAAAPDVNIITASKQQSVSVPLISTTYGQEPSAINVASNDGSYQFSYTTHDSSRHESADAANNVQGNFEFVADDAQRRRVDYRAGAETGFVATGAHLPVSVQDTAAVASAKASFKSAYDVAAAAAAAAPDTDIITGAVPVVAVNTATYSVPTPQNAYLAPAPVQIKYAGPAAPLDASGRVDDTPEVKAAKAAFRAAYDAAAAAAAAAPDNNIITGTVPVTNIASYGAVAPQTTYFASAPVVAKYDGPAAPVDASGRVVDTAEVKAAKAAFQAAFDAAAAAAEAASDDDIISASHQSPSASYSAGSVPVTQVTYTANHGSMRTITFDGITLMQADGGNKYGYSYE